MKTRKLSLLALAAIAALATSCTGDELNDNNNQKGIVIKATAGTPQGGADTRLAHTDGSTKMSIVWADDDAFTVYGGNEKRNYTIDGAGGNASASFGNSADPWSASPSGNVYAIYPTNATASPTAIALSLEGQAGTLGGLKDFNYMTAKTTYTSGDLSFGAFAHQVAIVKLVLTFPADVTATEATEVGLKATGLNKSAVLDLTTGAFSGKTPGDVTTGATPVTITSRELTAYLCVFDGALTDAKAVAKVGSDNYAANLTDLTIEVGNMYTATVTLTKQAPSITWATGNLVAKAGGGCEIGAATDKGLFFQFGSLVGWNTEDPLEIAVRPNGFNGQEGWAETGKIWQGTTGTVPFTVKDSGSGDEKAGIGDPCRYYLGDTWRLPTNDEYVELFNNNGYPSTGPWKWENASATNSTKTLTFPSSGYRARRDGSLSNVGTDGYCWSASQRSAIHGYILYFSSSTVNPSIGYYRAYGLPVRCVQEK